MEENFSLKLIIIGMVLGFVGSIFLNSSIDVITWDNREIQPGFTVSNSVGDIPTTTTIVNKTKSKWGSGLLATGFLFEILGIAIQIRASKKQ
jgi:hypothetical protein